MKTSLASHFGAISVGERLKIENAIIRNYSLADFTYFYILHHNVACLRVSLLLDLVEPVLRLSLICQHFHSVFLFRLSLFFRVNTPTLSQIVHLCGPKTSQAAKNQNIVIGKSGFGGRSSRPTPLFAQSNQRVHLIYNFFYQPTLSTELCHFRLLLGSVPLTSVSADRKS